MIGKFLGMSSGDWAFWLSLIITGVLWLFGIFMKYYLARFDPPIIVPKFRTEAKAAIFLILWLTSMFGLAYLFHVLGL
ncbi:MAG: hypothetical protein AMXMBFR49_20340 [Chlorobiota bacterium]